MKQSGTAFDVLLSIHGARVLTAGSPAEGLSLMGREAVDLVIQDMNFRREATTGEEGVTLFHEIRSRFPDVPPHPVDGVDAPRDGSRIGQGWRG